MNVIEAVEADKINRRCQALPGRMRRGDLIFVYGTLRNGERRSLGDHNEVTAFGQDKVQGALYDLGWYPGIKLITTGPKQHEFDPDLPAVHGDLFKVVDESITDILDGYEGHPTLFRRRRMFTANAKLVWVYEYQNEVSDNFIIPGGDWCNRITIRM